MRIRRITIRNYKGITERAVDVGAHGAVVSGRNGSGKTSVLDGLRAALSGRNVGPDAVRLGADRAELLVDLDDVAVRRVIDGRGTRVELEPAQRKPAAFVAGLLGAGQLDPVELLLEKDAGKRRAAILGALPMRVTAEQLRELVPGVEPGDCSGHALEVVSRLAKLYEERRRVANAEARDAAERAARAHVEVTLAPPGALAPGADAELEAARRARAQLEARAAEAAAAAERSAATRAKVAELEAAAADKREWAPVPDEASEAQATKDAALCRSEIAALEHRITVERARLERADNILSAVGSARTSRTTALAEASALESQASELRAAIAAGVEPPTPAELAAAARAAEAAAARAEGHGAALRRAEAERRHSIIAREAAAAQATAAELDTTLRALRSDVPAALIQQSGAIPGLAIDGDSVTLDGVSLDQLNDAARLRLAVQVAKRASPKVKVLAADRLELLDPEQYAAFVAEAIADGWQLIGARVAAGELRVEAIDAGEEW